MRIMYRKHQLGFAGRTFTGNSNCGLPHCHHRLLSVISTGFVSRKIDQPASMTPRPLVEGQGCWTQVCKEAGELELVLQNQVSFRAIWIQFSWNTASKKVIRIPGDANRNVSWAISICNALFLLRVLNVCSKPKSGMGEVAPANSYGVSFWVETNVLELTVLLVAQPCEYTKITDCAL